MLPEIMNMEKFTFPFLILKEAGDKRVFGGTDYREICLVSGAYS